ncbi:MAG TPA: Hsp20/alpha crystallin family protein [Kiritimatiellia bacterium]|nr:Hsp20/alpha crystallin family protein [Kiritimatiellia bacterium]
MVKNLIPWKRKKHEVEVLKPQGDPTYDLTRGMSDMVNQLFRRFDPEVSSFFRPDFGWSNLPAVDIAETDKEITVTADLPGLDEQDIHVSLENDTLLIRGERKHEKEEKNKNYYRVERSYGTFHRSIALPDGADRDNIKATFKKGVLNVTIGKMPGAKAARRQIPVTVG